MAQRPFSYSSYDPQTRELPVQEGRNAWLENTSAVLGLYTRDLKSFVSRRAIAEKGNLAAPGRSLKITARPFCWGKPRKMQDA
jgi:hypothetical protein